MRVQELICPERVALCLPVDTKPLLLEKLGELLSRTKSGPTSRAAFSTLKFACSDA